MDLIITGIVAALGLVIGWFLGQGAGRRPFEDSLGALSRGLRNGEMANVASGPEAVRAVAAAVEASWTPALNGPASSSTKAPAARSQKPREKAAPQKGVSQEAAPTDKLKQAALWEALHRVSKHLSTTVQKPLADAASGDSSSLREGVTEALGALEDIDFFLGAPPEGTTEIDLGETVQEVIADFGEVSDARPKQRGPRRPIQVIGNADALKDALFLILHNAEQFGEGRAIDVVVRVQDGHGRVHVRDRGKGFSADALSRAYDPFYTTVDGNLGLGLAHARKLIEDAGGKIHLLNSERGGGEVEIGLPLTS